MHRRFLHIATVLLALFGPAAVACLMCYGVAAIRGSAVDASDLRTPNPAKAPIYFLSPIEVAVYGWPRWAGIIGIWLVLWSSLALATVIIALSEILRPAGLSAERSVGRRWLIFAASSVGLGLAAPWITSLMVMAVFAANN